jgi:hypothetical protein
MLNILFCLMRGFLSNAGTLAHGLEIEAITVACSVYAFIFYRIWLHSRRNARATESRSTSLLHYCARHEEESHRIGCCVGTGQKSWHGAYTEACSQR